VTRKVLTGSVPYTAAHTLSRKGGWGGITKPQRSGFSTRKVKNDTWFRVYR